MNPSPFRLSIVSGAPLLAAAVLMLGGCSPSQDAASVITPAAAQIKPQSQVAVARGKIDVEGGLLDLSSAASGVVQQLLVKEGQSVQKGQPVLRLADDAARADLAVAESELQLAQTKLKTRQNRLPALKATLTRWQSAAKQGAADLQSVDEAVQALRDAQSEVDIAAAEVTVAKRKAEQLRALLQRHELRAPEAAVVVRLQAQGGSMLQSGSPVAVLLPKRPFIVRAEVNESFVTAIREGMKALVSVDADGSAARQEFPAATVLRISPVYGAAKLQDDAQRGPVRVVECVLAFDQQPANVKVGQNVRVSFHE
ncbi:HlyD family efflux transporter periplasmic adaptor subunit [Comamonas thiooxydans]|uniref:HlyD family secretion protein n=1 Tax=Comamonas thiooxydans TaxID=363952 RepID=UPI00244B3183|nr:HlyD family efflux transporter periplasmic adaptor subunit [Comamonas thiooxydans]MDH1475376.1 HlyD family efflux transporter periplasmic adaptor subunit [Comamonas thiooxydans]